MKKTLILCLCLFLPVLRALALEVVRDPRVEAHLEKAEENVRLAVATERRIAERLDALRAQEGADTNVVAATSRYLEEVRALLATHRQTLADLRAIAKQEDPANDPIVAKGLEDLAAVLSRQPIPENPEDPVAKLDAEFEATLNGFDTVLLERMAKLEATMEARAAEGASTAGEQARAAADAAALLRGMGVDPGVPAAPAGTPGTGNPPASAGTPASAGIPGEAGSPGAGGATTPAPQDEDIVARQLREAAERETDPVLREKLWKEYEAYVSGRS
jgi:hypothetical protein